MPFTFTEAPFSLNTRVVTAKGYIVQITVRAETCPETISGFAAAIKAFEELGAKPDNHIPSGNGHKQEQTEKGPDGEEYAILDPGAISSEFLPDGKKVFRFKNARYSKFGVRVWPEVAGTLGEATASLAPGVEKNIAERAKVLMKDGKPQKVVEFMP